MNDKAPDQAAELEIKAKHRQELARIEHEHEREMALVDAEAFRRMPFALRLLFDDRLAGKVEVIANRMAEAKSVTPPHLLGNPAACHFVVTRAIGWNLDPQQVALCTYQTPDGKLGIEGKLARAILEASGELRGAIRQEWYGPWEERIPRPSFKMIERRRQDGRTYRVPEPAWEYWGSAEHGLGVRISATLASTGEEISLNFDLVDAYPRNATTWPTRPKLQILNPAIRAFANMVRPSLLMGVRFAEDDEAQPEMRDVTPRDEAQARRAQPLAAPKWFPAYSADGEEFSLQAGELRQWAEQQVAAAVGDELDVLIENNQHVPEVAVVLEAAVKKAAQRPQDAPGRASEAAGTETPGDHASPASGQQAQTQDKPRRGRPKKPETIVREIIAELQATDPDHVEELLDHWAIEIAALSDEFQEQIRVAARDHMGINDELGLGDESAAVYDEAEPHQDNELAEDNEPQDEGNFMLTRADRTRVGPLRPGDFLEMLAQERDLRPDPDTVNRLRTYNARVLKEIENLGEEWPKRVATARQQLAMRLEDLKP